MVAPPLLNPDNRPSRYSAARPNSLVFPQFPPYLYVIIKKSFIMEATQITIQIKSRESGVVMVRFGNGINDWFLSGPDARISDIMRRAAKEIEDSQNEAQ